MSLVSFFDFLNQYLAMNCTLTQIQSDGKTEEITITL